MVSFIWITLSNLKFSMRIKNHPYQSTTQHKKTQFHKPLCCNDATVIQNRSCTQHATKPIDPLLVSPSHPLHLSHKVHHIVTCAAN
jgi:hypothetical protein